MENKLVLLSFAGHRIPVRGGFQRVEGSSVSFK